MRYRHLLGTMVLSAIILATGETAFAQQQDSIYPDNNTIQNRYTYAPITYERGSSTQDIRMFPNPTRSNATLYVNSIQEKDKGEVLVYNNRGKIVFRNVVTPGNNNLDVANLSTGLYTVKIYTKDRSIYTQQLVVTK